MFPYSERKGTASSTMKEKVDNHEKKERARRLIDCSHEIEIAYMNQFKNQKVEVLVEETIDGYSYGHTGNYLYIKIKGEYPHNEIVEVTIKEIDYPYCVA